MFCNVGSVAAKLAEESGGIIVGVSDARGAIYNPKGLPVQELYEKYSGRDGGINLYKDAEHITNAELLELPCDVLIPAALAGQITQENADKIQAKMIVEAANGPTTPEADQILNDKGVLIVPDILANAGGVSVSYFEWVQDLQNFFWEESEVNKKLENVMRSAYCSVSQTAQEYNIDLRMAAQMIGVKRVAEATYHRGIFP